MKFSNEILEYLNGKKFSDGLHLRVVDKVTKPQKRIDFICNLIKDKKVIHIGFADHIPLIDEKIKNNTWLHKLIVDKAHLCIGLDIDQDAVKYVRDKYNFTDLFCADIITDEILPVIKGNMWDYMILGEILEHVDNPIYFLQKIREKYNGYAKELIISVPNALDLNNLRNIKTHKEYINTDHRYWFTPYTLAKNAMRAGYEVGDFQYVHSYMPEGFLWRYLLNKFPMLRETIVMTVKL